ncbi:hypothetical protein Lesp02_02290 [Lentzea sp. NBRC 105346]|nr:hypothetical protein Lesp02_02290 [Lentzea sp. NBRC 105346]
MVASRVGVVNFLAGIWLTIAPLLIDFSAAASGFRPYRTAILLAVLVMVLGVIGAVAPLVVPWLSIATGVLGMCLLFAPFVSAGDKADDVVRVNQLVFGGVVVVASLADVLFRGMRRV